MAEPTTLLGPGIALFRWVLELAGKRPKPHVHLKTRGDDYLQFWVVFQPNVPGEPLWAVIKWRGERGRISALWPTAFDAPWGIQGDANEASYVTMRSAREAALQARNDGVRTRGLGSPRFEVTEEMLARWGNSDHVRACFNLDLRQLDERALKRAKLEVAVRDQVKERAKMRKTISRF